jgi:hypothetical protein
VRAKNKSSGDSVAPACGGIFIEETFDVWEKRGDAPRQLSP